MQAIVIWLCIIDRVLSNLNCFIHNLEGKRVISITKSATWVASFRIGLILFFSSICLMAHAETVESGQGNSPQQMLVESVNDLEKTLETVNKEIETLFDLAQEDMVPSIIESKFKELLGKTRNVLGKLGDGERLAQNLVKLLQLTDSEIKKIGDNPSSQILANNLKSLQESKSALKLLQADLVRERELATVEFNKLLDVEVEIISSLKTGAIKDAVSKAKQIPDQVHSVGIALKKLADSTREEALRSTIPQQ